VFSVGIAEEIGEGIGSELERRANLLGIRIFLSEPSGADLVVISPLATVRRARGRYVILPGESRVKVSADCAVTYGLCARDTVTMSSLSEDSMVISLQRNILTLGSGLAECQEIPVALSGRLGAAGELCVTAALLALGVNPLKLTSIT